MSRCDYDVIFYRVFCLSLLVIAFIFTVILTNVFVDIDGLLSKKEKAKSNHVTEPNGPSVTLLREPKPEIVFNEEKNYEDTEDGYRKEDVYVNEEETYRNKRSLEARNFIFHLQNPNVKHILTNHLNALLEQMDAEEFKTNDIEDSQKNNNKKEYTDSNEEKTNKKTQIDNDIKTSNNAVESNANKKSKLIKATVEIKDVDNKSKIEEKSQNEMLHLAMHDILLQGIIGHMDLSEVYKKFNMLKANFEATNNKKSEEILKNGDMNLAKQDTGRNIEGKFFEELIKCKDLQHQILKKENKDMQSQKAVENKKPEVVVKTLIDISSIDGKPQLGNRLKGKEVKGIIKLIYNGKPVKVRLSSSEETNSAKTAIENLPKTTIEPANIHNATIDENFKEGDSLVKLNIPQSFLNKAIANYFKKYSKSKRSINDKRYKRHIKIHYDPINKTKSEDDELYVEIETHFDSKGLKGEKRKKMIRTLIEKIQKAIHSNIGSQTNKTKKHFHAHVKKRIQNPLIFDNPDTLVVKKVSPIGKGKVEHRHLDPIGKADSIGKAVDGNKNDVPNIYDKSGEGWKRPYSGPGFLAPSKALNSAEMSEVDVDYNRVMTFNGIPQRLQKPLNSENSEETLATNYYDLGNLKFFVKDMDGSGISVGFNQYTDEEPDPETIKIFTGVDNLVKVYNHNYEQTGPLDEAYVQNQNVMEYENNGEIHNDHTILRRSAVEEDYHSNEYKMVFDSNYLPYDSYQDIFERKDTKEEHNIKPKQPTENVTDQPITMDIFDKKLKPSEIFSLANLLEEYRKKRSITVQKYSNIKTRRKLNKYLQTKPSKLFINKKRMKRHIDKIRIIATDKSTRHPHKQSDENIFVVSNEDESSNRAVLSEVFRPDEETISERIVGNDKIAEKVDEVYNYNRNPPINYNQMYDDGLSADNYITHVFDGRSRHNPLMSKYPHVFMEEISKSKEGDIEPAVYGNLRSVMANINNRYNIDQYDMPVPDFDTTTRNYLYVSNSSTPQMIIREPNTKAKYKLTVKIVPKNMTEMKSGFKEIHTSINKSYDKDGLRFYSLVNVSEISKIENLEAIKNRSRQKDTINLTTTTPIPTVNPHLKAQQFKMKSMLKRHKQMIDMQLAHFKKEKEHLERFLVTNQSDSDEVLDLKLPGESRPLQMKKSDISKLLASVLRNDQQVQRQQQQPQQLQQQQIQQQLLHQQQQLQQQQQLPSEWPSTVFIPQTQPISSTRTITTTTKATTTYATITSAPIPTPVQSKGTDKRLINIIEKNGKLTKEILNKIDKNTEMLETFLVKLIDRIERPPSPPTPVEYKEQTDSNKPKDIKMFPSHDEFLGKHTKNDTNYAIPFIYAYQHPYINPDKPNTPVANVVYHGHIHTDNSQLTKEVMNANSRIVIPKVPQKPEQLKPENKGKFFIDSDMQNGYKALNPMVHNSKSAMFPNQGMSGMQVNVTKGYADKL